MNMVANLSGRQKAIVGLTLATAIIHLILGIQFTDLLFSLNFLGYVVLVIALYFVPQLAAKRSLVRWGLIGYTALTIILYFFINPDPLGSIFGLVTKVIEVVLIVLLLQDK
jgi:uncharacterized membrane protein YccC